MSEGIEELSAAKDLVIVTSRPYDDSDYIFRRGEGGHTCRLQQWT